MSLRSRHVARFMPYACDREGLRFVSVRAALDGRARGELTPGATLAPREPWSRLELSLAIEARAGVLGEVLPEGEASDPPVTLLLAARCPATCLSRPTRVEGSSRASGRYELTISLQRSEIRDELVLAPYLVRTRQGPPTPGFARRKGAWLASGAPWTLLVDEPTPNVGAYLEVVHKRFSEAPEVPARDRGNWFYLDLLGTSPRLLLNDDHAAIMQVLGHTESRGRRAALRDLLFDQLDATVWPALVLRAASASQAGACEGGSWEENVLRAWARRLGSSGQELAVGVERLVGLATEPATLMLTISAALQREGQGKRAARLIAEVAP